MYVRRKSDTERSRSTRRGRAGWKVVPIWCVCCWTCVLSGCEKDDSPAIERPPANVSVVTVEPRDVPVSFQYVAQVQSSRQVVIQARVNGFLERREYTEGAIVQEGDTLFRMDQKPFQAQLDQAVAALARQEAAFDVAKKNLDRIQPLAAANALSQKDLDDATGRFESTGAAVEQAKAAVEQARLNLSYTVIASPVTGIAGAAEQADGTYLGPANSRLTSVTELSPVYVNFSISENEILTYRRQAAGGRLTEPQDKAYIVEVILADGSIFPQTGRVTFADPSFNPQTGTFLLRATFDNPQGLLRPNQYVHIRLKGASRPRAILVPQRAVQESSKGQFVWVVDQENKAQSRPVIVGEWHENDWFIYEGLQAGDRVVVDGVLTLRPGTSVNARPLAENTEGTKTTNP